MLAIPTKTNASLAGTLLALGALSMVLLGGCMVGPNYHRPATPVSPNWSMSDHVRSQGEPAQLGSWWSHFNDPVLENLIGQSLHQNFTLREAGERIIEARARRDIASGNLFPQSQSLDGVYSKSRLSSVTPNFFAFPGVFQPNLFPDSWTVGLNAAWELDFWGRYRRAVESADASLDATCAAYDEARVLMLAEVAQAYVEIRTLENRMAIAQKNLAVQRRTLELAEKKKQAGLATGLDIAQAETNVGQTEAVLPSLEIARRKANHRLCVLLGRPPADLMDEIGFTGQIPHPPHNLAFGIPADLLRRRPDVRRTERELAAQSARIGIAESEFYPHISLTGNLGFAAEDFGDLISSAGHTAAISPNFSWNLLNYGRIKNNVVAEKAAFRAMCNAYHASVLKATQEAEDAQVAFILSFDRADSLFQSVRGASDAVEKSETLYSEGAIDFGRVYVLQSQVLIQQDQLAIAQGQIASNLIELFRSLGGGWSRGTPTVLMSEVSHAEPIVIDSPPPMDWTPAMSEEI
ncbi:efflux transporter outer membrane subunit [Stieleria varia]|uniref:Outer membrane protein OprM n=1 Tax=Stieleria varia TaxID=2528005 RepID=A0A5C6AZS3_9BACT|nr:efflux transporter outer membrane subunit [Stieleria varia]TWU05017.1 Outer membrane protein OprM precursor [Stieleria varia]